MPDYIVEAHTDVITFNGKRVGGRRAVNYPSIYLFRVPLDATPEEIRTWTGSVHGQDDKDVRRSPTGTEPWWICIVPSKATGPNGERSDGKPLG
jgi:hypothetical protein